MVAYKGSIMILPFYLWGYIICNRSIVAAEFDSIGLKTYLISSPQCISQCEYFDCSNFTVLFSDYSWKIFRSYFLSLSLQYTEQIHLVFLQCKFLTSLLVAAFWFANFVASSTAICSTAFYHRLNLFVFFNEFPTSDWSKCHFNLFRKCANH